MLTKSDLIPAGDGLPLVTGDGPWGAFVISSVTGSGVEPLLEALWAQVVRRRAVREEAAVERGEAVREPPARDGSSSSSEEAWWNLAEEEA